MAEVVRRCRNILRNAEEDAKERPLPKNASDAEKQLQASRADEDVKDQPLPDNASDVEQQLQTSLDSIAQETCKAGALWRIFEGARMRRTSGGAVVGLLRSR